MSPLLIAGIVTIFMAFAAYTVGVVSIERGRLITRRTAVILTFGLVFDVTATACMAALSSGPTTLHGWVGHVALAIMLLLVVFAWRHRSGRGEAPVAGWFRLYVWATYLLWLLAFIMGIVLGASR